MDYGLGLLTFSKSQLAMLKVIQNQGMIIILGCTRDTQCEANRHVLGLLSMPQRQINHRSAVMRNIPCMIKSVEKSGPASEEEQNEWIMLLGQYLGAVTSDFGTRVS